MSIRAIKSQSAARPTMEGAGDERIRFLLVSGKPLKEPVAWCGPIVMHTEAELHMAVRELQPDSFIR